MLATLLVFGIGISRSAGCTRSAQAQRIEEVLFGLKIKRAGKIMVSTVWIHPYEQINGWREIAGSRVAPRLGAMDSAYTACRKDSSRPSKRCVARDLVASAIRHSGVQGVRILCCSTSRNPEPRKRRKRPKSGPQYHEATSAVHPQETPGARLGSSPFRPSRFQGAKISSVHIPMREVPGVSRTRAHSIVEWIQGRQISEGRVAPD
jgi:hypothetical protein